MNQRQEKQVRCIKCKVEAGPDKPIYVGVAKRIKNAKCRRGDLLLITWCLRCGSNARDVEGNRAKLLDPAVFRAEQAGTTRS